MLDLFNLWACVEGLGLLGFPLSFLVFRNLPDRGWAFSKTLALAIFSFCVWCPLMYIHILPYDRLFLLCVLLPLVCLGLAGWFFSYAEISKFMRHNVAYLFSAECVFTGMVFLLGFLRMLKPDIQGFETFMDEGFMASIMRSPHFPPEDMWVAGQNINYYYYAQFVVASLAKLNDQPASVAFNTGISLFFGLTASNLFGVASNVVAWGRYVSQDRSSLSPVVPQKAYLALFPAVPYGLLSVLMGLILGNLAATQQWWQNHGNVFQYDWFAPSRVIAGTINEFPAFSFLLSCFHAHVLDLAFTTMCIALAFNLFLEPEDHGLALFGRGWRFIPGLLINALVLGVLYPTNGWDYPTYIVLFVVCIALQHCMVYTFRISLRLIGEILLSAGCVIALSYLLYLPFYFNFHSPLLGIAIVPASIRSSVGDELLIYGLFIFVFLSLLFASAWPHSDDAPSIFSRSAQFMRRNKKRLILLPGIPMNTRQRMPGLLRLLVPALLLSVCLIVCILLPDTLTFTIMCIFVVLGGVLLFHCLANRSHAFVLLLGITAFALVAFCEVLCFRDYWDGTSTQERLNTVFKFYFQAWALLALSSSAGLYFIFRRFRPFPDGGLSVYHIQRTAVTLWSLIFLSIVTASMVYPLIAPYARYVRVDATHSSPYISSTGTLDGLAYLRTCHPPQCSYDTSGDYQAILWLNTHIQGDPVIVEAFGNDYSWYSRISSLTGLPTIMGEYEHEEQWRYTWINSSPARQTAFSQRVSDVSLIYTSPSPAVVLATMKRYSAQYIYVGLLEKEKYPNADLSRFRRFMRVIYDANGVTIYSVR